MDINELLHRICRDVNLGALGPQPERVSGGYMHKMYRLETAAGTYAVKLLNPVVMDRPDVFENYEKAERLERILEEKGFPVVPAIEMKGRKMQKAVGQYYYLFPWVEGEIRQWHKITKEDCEIIGGLLAGIHKIEMRDMPFGKDGIDAGWDAYITLAHKQCPEIEDGLTGCRDILYEGQILFNGAVQKMPPGLCICNGDMDSKNVLWVGKKPYIIDLECLDYGYPFWEMFQLALSWSGIMVNDIKFSLLQGFISSYFRHYGSIFKDWDALYGSGYYWLEWLEYNVHRALGIEGADGEEREMAIEQVHKTISRIRYYHSIKETMLCQLSAAYN